MRGAPEVLQRMSAWTRAVITGGAGLLGTHLCRRLLAAGTHVVCIDNFLTSSPVNIETLRAEPGFVLHEADVAEGLDIGNPEEATVLQIAERIIGLSGSCSGIEHIPLPEDDPLVRCPDITLAATALGWQPEISWREGLSETLDWFSVQLQAGVLDATALAGSAVDPSEQRTVRA